MKKRLFALFLAVLMILGAMPTQAIATIVDGGNTPDVTEPCVTDGCTLGKDHTGYCSNAPEYCQETTCKLHYKEVHTECIFCETEGCTQAKVKHDLCVMPSDVVPTDPADVTEPCATEGCTLGKDHAGYCSNAPEYCENASCLLHRSAEHTVCEYCATEGCKLKNEAHAQCEVPVFCENESCLLHKSAEHTVCEYCATEGCKLKNETHTECKTEAAGDVTKTTEPTDPTEPIRSGMVKATAPAPLAEDPDKPTSLNNQQVYVAVYSGNVYTGEPAWYSPDNYTFIGSNFRSGSRYSSDAADVLNPEILNNLTQGPTTNGVKVWGYHDPSNTRSMIQDTALLNRTNEEKIIRSVLRLRDNADVSNYKIIWYVIKYQTDTDWHIDGLLIEVDTYNVNYYGNGNTGGSAPSGEIDLKTGDTHSVSSNTGRLVKRVGAYTYTFDGWNTKADGTGTSYAAGDSIKITDHDISLYAQWKPPVTSVTISKRWEDNNDAAGHRPESVSIKLLANGTATGTTVTLPQNGNWTTVVENLPVVDGQQNLITYSIEETTRSELYTAGYSGNQTDGLIVTNTLKTDLTEISDHLGKVYITGNKNWLDRNNATGHRPNSITVNLYADGQVVKTTDANGNMVNDVRVLSAENNWKSNWSDLPKNKNEGGTVSAIVYTVKENVNAEGQQQVIPGYKDPAIVKDTHLDGILYNITNAHDPAATSVTVTKIWSDEDNNDGKRPEYITVQFLADGTPMGEPVQLREITQWKHTWTEANNLPLYVNKNVNGTAVPIRYSVMEVEVPGGYTERVEEGETKYQVVITNTYTTEKTSVSVGKEWDDGDNNDGKRPESVKVTLQLNGQPVASYVDTAGSTIPGTVTLSQENDWKYTWSDLYVYKAGELITYTVAEEEVEGYEAQITGSAADGFTITNVHEPEVWETNITKVWRDNNSSKRPSSITVQLYKDGVAYGDSFKIRKSDDWKFAVQLPVYEKGKKIEWTVKETKVPTYYNVSYDQATLTITNKIKPSKDNPLTGDLSGIGMWAGMMATSGTGAAMLLLFGKKKKPGKYEKR